MVSTSCTFSPLSPSRVRIVNRMLNFFPFAVSITRKPTHSPCTSVIDVDVRPSAIFIPSNSLVLKYSFFIGRPVTLFLDAVAKSLAASIASSGTASNRVAVAPCSNASRLPQCSHTSFINLSIHRTAANTSISPPARPAARSSSITPRTSSRARNNARSIASLPTSSAYAAHRAHASAQCRISPFPYSQRKSSRRANALGKLIPITSRRIANTPGLCSRRINASRRHAPSVSRQPPRRIFAPRSRTRTASNPSRSRARTASSLARRIPASARARAPGVVVDIVARVSSRSTPPRPRSSSNHRPRRPRARDGVITRSSRDVGRRNRAASSSSSSSSTTSSSGARRRRRRRPGDVS